MSEKQSMLSTVDNPFDPFTEYDDWFQWDEAAGYYTPGLLARFAVTSPELSEVDQSLAIEEAIDEIVKENPLGVHMKVVKEV